MLRTIALAVLIGFFSATAFAQQPKPTPAPSPSPSPAPARGTEEYSVAALKKYDDAVANYEAASANPQSDLQALNNAQQLIRQAAAAADEAVTSQANAEAKGDRDLKDAIAKYQAADDKLRKLEKTDDEIEKTGLRLQKAEAIKKANKIIERYEGSILRRLNHEKPDHDPPMTNRHYQLEQAAIEAARKANAEAQKKKAEAEKKAQPSPSPEPPKTSCAPSSGLTGALNNVTCQMQHSGATH